jgi:hypothetical protein
MDPHRPRCRAAVHRASFALLAAAHLAAGCEVPNFQGPQIQNPPPAFTMNREATEERPMFPDRAIVHHDAWVEASWGNFSGIYINGHPGTLGSGEVEAARRGAMAAAAGRRVQFGEVESLQVDGRTAWGWEEKWLLENGGLQYVVFRAAIPYDTITYAVDFIAGEPGLKSRPDSLRTIVASFAVGETRLNWPVILIVSGVVLFLGNLVHRRRKERAARHRSIPLATIPKKQKDADKPGAATQTGPAAEPGEPPVSGSVASHIQMHLSQKKPPPKA